MRDGHPMLGLDREHVRATIEHLRLLQKARAEGYRGSYTTDPRWLVEQAINRRGGYVDDPHGRGSCLPLPDGRFPPKASVGPAGHLWQLAQRINTPRLRVYESELGEWGPYLRRKLPHRFTRFHEE